MANYNIDIGNPIAQGLQGYALGQQIGLQRQQMAEQQQAAAAAQAKQQQQMELQQKLAAFSARPGKSAQEYISFIEQNPTLYNAIKEPMQMVSEKEKQADILDAGQIMMLAKSGKKDLLMQKLAERKQAYLNSNKPDQAQFIDMMITQADMGEEGLRGVGESASFFLATVAPEQLRKNLETFGGEFSGGESGKVVKSEIYPDGTTLSIMSSGSPVITSPDGTILKGRDAANAIIKAQEYGSDLAKKINWNRETGKLEAQDELKAQVEGKTVQAKEQAKSEEQRSQDFISKGLVAADSIPTLKRSIELLKSVKTGGFQSALIRAKGAFGIQGADEGELTYNLSKNVLSQLKSTFGAQFTEREGAWLNRIESGIGRNNATNIAIINQALKTAERKVKKAISIAKKNGDWDTVAELEDLMSFSLSPSNKTKITKQTTSLVPGRSGTESTQKYTNEQQQRIEVIKRQLSGQ